jgi:2-polyprenyl-3-methyl-5-hydroxy-6-metoxy-1,4-benzoquinol methylase
MRRPAEYSFSEYLAAKKSVDDRALNRHVWGTLAGELRTKGRTTRVRILEVGAGIGTMIERVITWGLIEREAEIRAIDPNSDHLKAARGRLITFADEQRMDHRADASGLITLESKEQHVEVMLEAADLEGFAAREGSQGAYDLIIAHAVLDLLDAPSAVRALLALAKEGGLLYLTITYDGATILEPAIDAEFDRLLEEHYHQTMDQRVVNGKKSGDRHTGRHLFSHLRAAGAEIIDAGSSDWVVFPGAGGYADDEGYFLHFIVQTIGGALAGDGQIDPARLAEWVEERHQQIERAEMTYIAHQIDLLARR